MRRWVVTATSEAPDGTLVAERGPDVLGEAWGSSYRSAGEAEQVADGLARVADAAGLPPGVSYQVEEVEVPERTLELARADGELLVLERRDGAVVAAFDLSGGSVPPPEGAEVVEVLVREWVVDEDALHGDAFWGALEGSPCLVRHLVPSLGYADAARAREILAEAVGIAEALGDQDQVGRCFEWEAEERRRLFALRLARAVEIPCSFLS